MHDMCFLDRDSGSESSVWMSEHKNIYTFHLFATDIDFFQCSESFVGGRIFCNIKDIYVHKKTRSTDVSKTNKRLSQSQQEYLTQSVSEKFRHGGFDSRET